MAVVASSKMHITMYGTILHTLMHLSCVMACRRDECDRVKKCGARVLTLDQLEGSKVGGNGCVKKGCVMKGCGCVKRCGACVLILDQLESF
eukprot:1158122-Pelagomonas_calceolata.AAC.10